MKIYLYNPETGAYFGEYSTEEVPESDAALLAPLRTTTVAPPEGAQGHLLVFDSAAQCWEVRSRPEPEKEAAPEPPETGPAPQQRQVCYYMAALLVVAGFVLAVAALCDYGTGFGLVSGVALILGTVACMSARERGVAPAKNTTALKSLEAAAAFILLASSAVIIGARGLGDSFPDSLVALAALASYLYYLVTFPKRSPVTKP